MAAQGVRFRQVWLYKVSALDRFWLHKMSALDRFWLHKVSALDRFGCNPLYSLYFLVTRLIFRGFWAAERPISTLEKKQRYPDDGVGDAIAMKPLARSYDKYWPRNTRSCRFRVSFSSLLHLSQGPNEVQQRNFCKLVISSHPNVLYIGELHFSSPFQ